MGGSSRAKILKKKGKFLGQSLLMSKDKLLNRGERRNGKEEEGLKELKN